MLAGLTSYLKAVGKNPLLSSSLVDSTQVLAAVGLRFFLDVSCWLSSSADWQQHVESFLCVRKDPSSPSGASLTWLLLLFSALKGSWDITLGHLGNPGKPLYFKVSWLVTSIMSTKSLVSSNITNHGSGTRGQRSWKFCLALVLVLCNSIVRMWSYKSDTPTFEFGLYSVQLHDLMQMT